MKKSLFLVLLLTFVKSQAQLISLKDLIRIESDEQFERIFIENNYEKYNDNKSETISYKFESIETNQDINSAIYVLGEKMLISFVKNSNDDQRIKYVNELIDLYDNWIKFFPKSKRGQNETGKILSMKAQSLIDYNLASDIEIVNIFDEAFTNDPKSFKSPKRLYNYFKTYFKVYKSGEGDVTLEKLFNKRKETNKTQKIKFGYYAKICNWIFNQAFL